MTRALPTIEWSSVGSSCFWEALSRSLDRLVEQANRWRQCCFGRHRCSDLRYRYQPFEGLHRALSVAPAGLHTLASFPMVRHR